MRLAKKLFSASLPLNHATNHSDMYAQPTTREVKRHSLAAASRWLIVTSCLRPTHYLIGMMIEKTIPMPEKMAPATKYGGKIVVCHPGVSAIAKSKDTTECTDNTSGVEKAARNRYARAKWTPSLSVLRQPSDIIEKICFRIGLIFSRSRSTAMSGIKP